MLVAPAFGFYCDGKNGRTLVVKRLTLSYFVTRAGIAAEFTVARLVGIGINFIVALGAIGAALTLQVQRGSSLVSLILIPLFIPLLIFATAAVENASMGLAVHGQLAILAAISVLTVTLAPLAVAAGIRMSVN
mgnify:CR=1 FL=1